ncbi:hypothetical protein HanRHA438_Chr01g0002091 [Helianthus annuus]|nr:hypothetical protein HanRHA438_Chr01g0002091 [Helianthus annuus]
MAVIILPTKFISSETGNKLSQCCKTEIEFVMLGSTLSFKNVSVRNSRFLSANSSVISRKCDVHRSFATFVRLISMFSP